MTINKKNIMKPTFNTLYIALALFFSVEIDSQNSFQEITTIEEIVVTSRRREESAQTVPVAISAYTENDLVSKNISTIDDVDNIAPNFSFFQNGSIGNASSVGIRGVGNSFSSSVREPSVGIYVDGAYISRQQGNLFDFWDLDRLEVIKGPQGTLFGRNNTTGAVQVIYNKPLFSDEAKIKVGFGSRLLNETALMFNKALSDSSAIRITHSNAQQQGYIDNSERGEKWGEKDLTNTRLQYRYSPDDSLNINLSYHKYKQGGSRNLGACRIYNPSALLLQSYAIAGLAPTIIENCNSSVPGVFGRESTPGAISGNTSRFTFSLEKQLGFATLTFIHADTSVDSELGSWGLGLESTSAPFISPQNSYMNSNYSSNELRLNGQILDDRLDWVFGLFNFTEDARSYSETVYFKDYMPSTFFQTIDLTCLLGPADLQSAVCINGENITPTIYVSAYDVLLQTKGLSEVSTTDAKTSSNAWFVEGTYAVNDNFNITLGYRDTSDKKLASTSWINPIYDPITGSLNRPISGPASSNMSNCLTPLTGSNQFGPDTCNGKKNFSDDTKRFIADYTFENGTMVYGSYSEGFVSGGFQNSYELPELTPEYVESFEFGTKGTYMNGRLRVNASYFEFDYQNKQVSIGYISETGSAVNTSQNVDSVDTHGYEVELTYLLNPNLLISYSKGFIDGSYNKFISIIDGADLSGEPYNAFGPEENSNISLTHTRNINSFDMQNTLSITSVGKNELSTTDNIAEPSYKVINFNTQIEFNEKVQFGIYGKNITDELYATTGYGSVELAGFFTKYYAPGAEYGVNLTYSF